MPPPESSVALFAWKGLLIAMNQRVSLELIGIRELGVTQLAWIRSLSSMYSHVSPQVGNLNKVSIAVLTVIRFLSSMKSHMSLEMMVSSESFITDSTLKGLLSCMSPLVILENMFVSKGSITDVACKLPFSSTRNLYCRSWCRWSRGWRVCSSWFGSSSSRSSCRPWSTSHVYGQRRCTVTPLRSWRLVAWSLKMIESWSCSMIDLQDTR